MKGGDNPLFATVIRSVKRVQNIYHTTNYNIATQQTKSKVAVVLRNATHKLTLSITNSYHTTVHNIKQTTTMTKIIDRVNPNSGIQLKDITVKDMLTPNDNNNPIFTTATVGIYDTSTAEILTYNYFNNGDESIALILEHDNECDVFLYTATINWDTVTKPKVITPCKFKVTPEQSAKVQEICFKNGYNWFNSNTTNIINNDMPYLYIGNRLPNTITCSDNQSYYVNHKLPELNYEEFVKMYE